MTMIKKFTKAIDYQEPTMRPGVNPIFMWQGIAVKWSEAPTTSEKLVLSLDVGGNLPETFEVCASDPTEQSEPVTDYMYMIPDGPIAVRPQMQAQVTYPNTDNKTVTVCFLGYFISSE